MDIQTLKNRIVNYNKSYRAGNSEISDIEYDTLLETLEKNILTNEFALFQNSLHEPAGKVKHPFIMGSLNKLKYEEPESVVKFIDDHIKSGIHVSAKIDGISCRLHYENGKLISASTRGDGEFGESLTDKIFFVKNVLPTIDSSYSIDIRGELVILKKDFEQMSGFANARNACAGIMNRKEWNPDDVKNVTFVPYTILGDKYTKSEQSLILEKIGFTVGWYKTIDNTFKHDQSFVDKLFEYATQEFDYETDGLVLSDVSYYNEFQYRPDCQVAFKINQLTATTRLIDIEWGNSGRPAKNGTFCPIGILEPVELGGSIISRVTLHNLDFIKDNDINFGSIVTILKSGDVIPHLISVENDSNISPISYPEVCPCCGTQLVIDGVNLKCPNNDCQDQILYHLMKFIKSLDVDGSSLKTLEKFKILSFKNLIDFKPNSKYKSEVKLYNELQNKVFHRSAKDLFGALNFVGLSETLICKIVDYYGFDLLRTKDKDLILSRGLPEGIGVITFNSFYNNLSDNLDILDMFLNDSRYSYTDAEPISVQKNGLSVCFTGALRTMTRSEASKKAIAAGFEVKGGVNKGLTYLVTNDKNSGSSKNKKAAALGTKIINEEEFINLIDNTRTDDTSDLDEF